MCRGVSAAPSVPQAAVFSPHGGELQSLESYSEYLEDPQGRLTVGDIANSHAADFKPITSFKSHGFTDAVYWVRITVDLRNFDEPYWFLRKDYMNIGRIALYVPTSSGYSETAIDEHEPLYGRMFTTTSFLMRVPTNRESPVAYYIRVEARHHHVNLLFSWGSDKAVIDATHTHEFLLGLFYGGCLIMLFYNAVLLLTTRDITYLYYLYYLVSFLIMFGSTNGVFSLTVPYTIFFVKTVMLSGLGITHGGILYVRRFLNLRATFPVYDKLLQWFSWLLLPCAIACLFFLPQIQGFQLSLATIPVATVLGLPICFYRWYTGFEPARIYCLGWVVCLVLGINYVLQSFGLAAVNDFAVYSVEAGSLWEIVMSSLALAYRIKLADQERKNALAHSKDALEKEVSARTKELVASRNDILRTDAEKRKLIQKVNTIVEEERRAIAIEIHDELNATLVGVRHGSHRIATLAAKLDQSQVAAEISTRAQSILDLTKSLYATGRAIVTRLRPETLDTLGLRGAIEEMVHQFDAGNPACRFKFESAGDFSEVDSNLAMAIYRVIQEALSNVAKHAKATAATISLDLSHAEALRLTVRDNGIGFDPKLVSHGLGIVGMRERVYGYNGTIDIRPTGTGGMEIEAIFPIAAN